MNSFPIQQTNITMVSMTNSTSEVSHITKFMMPNMNTNGTMHPYMPYILNVDGTEFNASYYNELILKNLTIYKPCPSIQMPVGNLISTILYAVVCIIGLFGNTLVIYAVLRFSKMKTVTNMYILNLAIADEVSNNANLYAFHNEF